MLLRPTKTKFLKYHRQKIKGVETRGTTTYSLIVGMAGIQALESGLITPRQLEAVRRTIVRSISHCGRVWVRVFPDSVVTSKPNEVRMGRGKGDLKEYVFKVRKGRTLFEISAATNAICKQALHIALNKLPLRCQIVYRGL